LLSTISGSKCKYNEQNTNEERWGDRLEKVVLGGAGDGEFLQVIHEHLQANVICQDGRSRLLQRVGFMSTLHLTDPALKEHLR